MSWLFAATETTVTVPVKAVVKLVTTWPAPILLLATCKLIIFVVLALAATVTVSISVILLIFFNQNVLK